MEVNAQDFMRKTVANYFGGIAASFYVQNPLMVMTFKKNAEKSIDEVSRKMADEGYVPSDFLNHYRESFLGLVDRIKNDYMVASKMVKRIELTWIVNRADYEKGVGKELESVARKCFEKSIEFPPFIMQDYNNFLKHLDRRDRIISTLSEVKAGGDSEIEIMPETIKEAVRQEYTTPEDYVNSYREFSLIDWRLDLMALPFMKDGLKIYKEDLQKYENAIFHDDYVLKDLSARVRKDEKVIDIIVNVFVDAVEDRIARANAKDLYGSEVVRTLSQATPYL